MAEDRRVGTTVLIVDDQRVFRRTARAVLETDGFDVVGEAPDGDSGLAARRRLRPDVVLVDVNLPDTDGFELARRLTADADGPAVVVTSSSDDPLYSDRAMRSGARGFVAKHDLCGAAIERLLA